VEGLSSALIVNGLILGWSVAWPPGPVNAEIIRRGTLGGPEGGGFWPALQVGLGAGIADFLWAFGVSAGAGAVINTPRVRLVLAVISFTLLLFLAGMFARAAWRLARARRPAAAGGELTQRKGMGGSLSRGWLVGFLLTLTSPWAIGFWLAVIGSQSGTMSAGLFHSVVLATAVVLGAMVWTLVLCTGLHLGARVFSRPGWQIGTQAVSAVVMLYFAARLVVQFA
jgi:threonine/homoserine/homoserine lactone efflux protein